MKYTVRIKTNGKTIYEVEVEACDENQALEFAYDMFEHDSYAEVE